MANYVGNTRTNMFKVTDERKYDFLFGGLFGDDDEEVLEFGDNIAHGFGSYASVDWRCPVVSVMYFMDTYNPMTNTKRIIFEDINQLYVYTGKENDVLDSIAEFYMIDMYRDDTSNDTLHVIITEDVLEETYGVDARFDTFLKELQQILADGETFVLKEVGTCKLRYFTSYAIIANNKESKSVILDSCIEDAIEKMNKKK